MSSSAETIETLRAELDRAQETIRLLAGKTRSELAPASTPIANGDLPPVTFDTIPDALAAIANGEFVVVLDDPGRENEGDLIIAGESMTKDKMAFMIRHTSGVVCVALPSSRRDTLQLPPMVTDNTERHQTSFTHSVDLLSGTSTGISAGDRALTICALANPDITDPKAFSRPGHIFPLVARDGGVRERVGHTEATVELCRLAGKEPVGALCEIVLDNGDMMRCAQLMHFAHVHHLKIITIEDLVKYVTELEK